MLGMVAVPAGGQPLRVASAVDLAPEITVNPVVAVDHLVAVTDLPVDPAVMEVDSFTLTVVETNEMFDLM